MRNCKWHLLQRNVYNKRSASRIDPKPYFCFASLLITCLCVLHVHQLQCDLFDIFKNVFLLFGLVSVEQFTSSSQTPHGIKNIQKKSISSTYLATLILFLQFTRHFDTKLIGFPPLRILVKFYICISHKNQLSILVFSCVIVFSFTFLEVIILIPICECVCRHLTSSLFRCDLVLYSIYK